MAKVREVFTDGRTVLPDGLGVGGRVGDQFVGRDLEGVAEGLRAAIAELAEAAGVASRDTVRS